MAGYCGLSMSYNAIEAYENGEKPISKWKKKKIIEEIEKRIANGELSLKCTLENLKKMQLDALKQNCLYRSSSHHTSMYYNWTDFYALDIDRIEKLTDESIKKIIAVYKKK